MTAQADLHRRFSVDADWDALFVDGEWRSAPDRDRIDVENPATRETIARVPAGTAEDVDAAYEAAVAAQEEWASTPPQRRGEIVRNVANLLEEHAEEVLELLAVESGSAPPKANIEHSTTVTLLHDVSSYPFRMHGRHAQSKVPGKENIVQREPVGTVGVIAPWNWPLKLSLRAIAPAIATGNTVVFKPAEDTPIVGGLLLARLFEEAGLPDGVFNVVTGYGEDAGDRTASHPDSDVVSFTGSTGVGQLVGRNAIEHFAEPALELGGNNAHVVLEDADLDRAVDGGVFGSFLHQGQICISINRHLVHESLYDEYVERMVDRASELKVGDPRDEDTVIGPLVNEQQRDQLLGFVEDTLDQGATLELGGGTVDVGDVHESQSDSLASQKSSTSGDVEDSLFVEPTVLSDVTNDMSAACNEHFGPVVPVIPFSDDDEAVELANGTEYGLSGSVHSADEGRARDVADRIETGMIHVNDQSINAEPHAPFGGKKSSGVGRYNGDWIIEEFTEPKWTSVQREPREYPF